MGSCFWTPVSTRENMKLRDNDKMSCSSNGGGGDKARALERVSSRKFYAHLFLNTFFQDQEFYKITMETRLVIIPQCREWAAGGSYEGSADGLILSASLLAQMAVVLIIHTKRNTLYFSNAPTHASRDALFGWGH